LQEKVQQSAESQHDVFAAFTAPARPSAITVINRIARIFFMGFSPLKNQMWWFSRLILMPSAETEAQFGERFLDA
jgi:hypothetical protein